MVRMYVRHPVADFDHWKQVYDDFEEVRKELGVQGHAVFQNVDDPNDVTAWHDFDSLDAAQHFAQSERLRDGMGEAGVTGEPTIWFTERA